MGLPGLGLSNVCTWPLNFLYVGTSFISDATDEEFGNAMASMYKYSTRQSYRYQVCTLNSLGRDLETSPSGKLQILCQCIDLLFIVLGMYNFDTRFDGLKDNTDYTVSISTELDGKTITQVTMTAVSKSGSSSPGASESQPQVSPGPNNKKDS